MDSKNNEIFKKFEEKYKRFILPKCEKLDIERMKINRQNFIIIFLYVAIVFYMLAFVFSDLDEDTITVSVFFSIFPPIAYIALRYTKFTNKIKREIINYFCASFEDLRWLDKKNYPFFQTVNTVLKDADLFMSIRQYRLITMIFLKVNTIILLLKFLNSVQACIKVTAAAKEKCADIYFRVL